MHDDGPVVNLAMGRLMEQFAVDSEQARRMLEEDADLTGATVHDVALSIVNLAGRSRPD